MMGLNIRLTVNSIVLLVELKLKLLQVPLVHLINLPKLFTLSAV